MTDLLSTLGGYLLAFLTAILPVFTPWLVGWVVTSLRPRTPKHPLGVTHVRPHPRSGGSDFPPYPPADPSDDPAAPLSARSKSPLGTARGPPLG